MEKEDLKSRFVGALLGTAIGDALGAPVEGYSMEMVESVYKGWKMISGRYTDDTEMMIGVAESLIENNGFNGEHMASRFIQNYDGTRGYGPGATGALRRISLGESWKDASKRLFGGEGSYGNGAAMRIAPVGVFYYDSPKKLREIVYGVSHITHAHELGKEGATLQAYAIALAVQNEKEDMLLRLEEFTPNRVYMMKLNRIKGLLQKQKDDGEGVARREVISALGNEETAFNSVPTAIYSFLRSTNFKNAIIYAVSLGGDTDTIGAMTGAISGAYYGAGSIPKEWEENLEEGEKGRTYIKKLAEKLYYDKYGRQSVGFNKVINGGSHRRLEERERD
jgi:poly(ADP-ribose) glycohydrolase ARH3